MRRFGDWTTALLAAGMPVEFLPEQLFTRRAALLAVDQLASRGMVGDEQIAMRGFGRLLCDLWLFFTDSLEALRAAVYGEPAQPLLSGVVPPELSRAEIVSQLLWRAGALSKVSEVQLRADPVLYPAILKTWGGLKRVALIARISVKDPALFRVYQPPLPVHPPGILNALGRLSRLLGPLTPTRLRLLDARLVGALRQAFPTWKAACQAAGLDSSRDRVASQSTLLRAMPPAFGRAEIILELLAEEFEAGLVEGWRRRHRCLSERAEECFGSLATALICAGVPVEALPRKTKWRNPRDILAALDQLSRRGVETLDGVNLLGLADLGRMTVRTYGGWSQGLRAGKRAMKDLPRRDVLPLPAHLEGRLPRDRLLDRLRQCADDSGQVHGVSKALGVVLLDKFGGVPTATRAAGLKSPCLYPREQVLAHLRTLAAKGCLRSSELSNGFRTACRRWFGGLKGAFREAGVSPNPKRRYPTPEKVLDRLIELAGSPEGLPPLREVHRLDSTLYANILRYFGGWHRAVELARQRAAELGLPFSVSKDQRQGDLPRRQVPFRPRAQVPRT